MQVKRSWPLVALLIVAAALAAWLVMRQGRAPKPAADSPASPVKPAPDAIAYPEGAPQLAMIRAQPAPALGLPVADALAARVAYDDDATARLFAPVAGRIVALDAQPGDRVRPGQVLARIDAPDFGTANADLAKARADEERKRLAYERARELGPGEGIAVKDVEAAQADYDAARAETARAAERVRNLNPRSLRVDGQRVALTSPLAGVVSERNATPSLEVAPGAQSPLFVVTDPRRLWLFIDVPEKLVSLIKTGARVGVESDAYPGETFEARIVQIGQTVDPNSRRVLARARVDNSQGKLLPEMFVRALVLQDAGQAVRVPNSAIVGRGIYSYVFVEAAPRRFERRRVELAVRGAESSFVSMGLTPDEKVVVTGALLLDAEVASAHRP
ncbi:MAG: efflux RND transporter periplasmic adaptor subunit [Rhizobacter sp.]|nr:efflux RND transporter periplasmic adaptor subunit [Rhizobacter sp.]